LQKGCVLDGKVTFIDNQLDNEDKMVLKNKNDRNGEIKSRSQIQRGTQKGQGRFT